MRMSDEQLHGMAAAIINAISREVRPVMWSNLSTTTTTWPGVNGQQAHLPQTPGPWCSNAPWFCPACMEDCHNEPVGRCYCCQQEIARTVVREALYSKAIRSGLEDADRAFRAALRNRILDDDLHWVMTMENQRD